MEKLPLLSLAATFRERRDGPKPARLTHLSPQFRHRRPIQLSFMLSVPWKFSSLSAPLPPKARGRRGFNIGEVTDTWLGPMWLSFLVPLLHVGIGLVIAYVGVKRPKWEN